jgi:ribosome-binding factor A
MLKIRKFAGKFTGILAVLLHRTACFKLKYNRLMNMEEGKRQKQVGALLLKELSDIFQRLGLSVMDGGLISLTAVKVTPDLLEARVYLSLFQVKDVPAAMKKIEDRAWQIKQELAGRIKQQLRRVPVIQYFHDDTLDHADKMNALFRKISEEKPPGEEKSE